LVVAATAFACFGAMPPTIAAMAQTMPSETPSIHDERLRLLQNDRGSGDGGSERHTAP
jgi:hypothetical protein